MFLFLALLFFVVQSTSFIERVGRDQWSSRFESVSTKQTNSSCIQKHEDGWDLIACSYNSTTCSDGLVDRFVYYSIPLTPPPPGGYPAVILFQGSFFKASLFFVASTEEPFGAFYQVQMTQKLLDNGFVVIAPNAMFGGNLFWDTNLPPWNTMIDLGLWPTAPDAKLLKNLFPMIASGVFGPVNMEKMHAGGISSGGYMASRMAFFYPSYFKSVTIASASFYYCSGPICAPPIQGLPGQLLPSHPPTLFLHGDDDLVVPIFTMYVGRSTWVFLFKAEDTDVVNQTSDRLSFSLFHFDRVRRMYARDLKNHNITHRVVVCDNCTHQWIRTYSHSSSSN